MGLTFLISFSFPFKAEVFSSRKSSYFLILLSLVIVALSQPAYFGWLGILASFFGYALFWKGLSYFPSSTKRFLCSLFWFALVQAVQLSWMTSTTYMGPLILVVYVFLSLGLGTQFALLSLLVPKKAPHFIAIVGIAGIWTIFEWARLFFISGFTWNPVGLALAGNPYSIGWASLFGIYGLSFWVIFINLIGYRALFFTPSIKTITLWILLGSLPFLFGVTQEKLYSFKKETAETLSVVLVQTALFPEERNPISGQLESFVSPWEQWQRILRHIKTSVKKKPDLIVLPESALPFSAFRKVYPYEKFVQIWEQELGSNALETLPLLSQPLAEIRERSWLITNSYWAQALANFFQSEVIIGLDDHDTSIQANYNAAFHFIPEKSFPQRYEKRSLVPLSEYIPYHWCRGIANRFGIYDSFTPGLEAKIFSGKIPFAVSICIEEIYSSLMRKNRKMGARLFVNITNDVWFPHSLLPKQHFHHGAVRAAENGIPLIRATNTGITGAVDSFGRTLKVLQSEHIPTERLAGSLQIDLPIICFPTLYTILGDGFIVSLSFLFAFLFFLQRYYSNIFFYLGKPIKQPQ